MWAQTYIHVLVALELMMKKYKYSPADKFMVNTKPLIEGYFLLYSVRHQSKMFFLRTLVAR